MLNLLTHNKEILWGTALCCSITAHIALLASCCNQAFSSNNAYSPPMAIMLSFTKTPSQPDIDDISDNFIFSESEIIPLRMDTDTPMPLETLPPAPIKTDFSAIQQPETIKKSDNLKSPKKIKSVQKKKQKAAIRQISAPISSDFSGAHDSLTSASNGISTIKWLAKVQSHLERQKNYLRKKRSVHHVGTVRMEFSVSRNGIIQTMRLVHSTGSAELEQMALNILKYASPLPRPPADQAGKRIVIPLVFR